MALPCARAWARRSRALAAALALAATLSGCQSNPEPPPLDHAATSSSPAPSPTLTAPTLPPEARGTSKAAAKAFVRHYVAAVNYAMATGDTSALLNLSDSSCTSCSAVADNIDQLYAGGGHLEGRGWSVTAINSLGAIRDGGEIIQAGVFIAPQRRFSRAQTQPKKYSGGVQSMTFFLGRGSNSWTVRRWSQSS